MDAPLHFFQSGTGIDTMLLSAAIGRARVIEIRDPESIKPEELRPHKIQRGERVLFKTRNSARCWQTKDFVEDFVYISQEAARYLAAQQVPLFNLEFFQEQLLRQTSELGINYRMSSLSQSHDWQHLWLPDGLSE